MRTRFKSNVAFLIGNAQVKKSPKPPDIDRISKLQHHLKGLGFVLFGFETVTITFGIPKIELIYNRF